MNNTKSHVIEAQMQLYLLSCSTRKNGIYVETVDQKRIHFQHPRCPENKALTDICMSRIEPNPNYHYTNLNHRP
jgi:hypothetical protein